MRITPEFSGVTVVLLGSFNPPIFNPDWMVRKGVIGEEDALNANIEVIHREVAAFEIASFALRVVPERFTASTTNPPFVALRDLVVNIFNSLPETPISKMGINFNVHFPVADFKKRDSVGMQLAPLEPWGDWGADIPGPADVSDDDFAKKHGGMASLTLIQNDIPDRPYGKVQAKVEPSKKMACGIFMEVNDHYEVGDGDSAKHGAELIGELESGWDSSLEKSEFIIDQIMKISK